jgi:hypothetical protein
LNNKMQGYQQRQQQAMQQQFDPRGGMDYNPQDQQRHQAMYAQRQMMEQALGRPSPFRQNPYQRQLGGGIQGLMGILGGRGGMPQPRMSMGMPQYQRAMTMDMPQARGFESELPTNFMKNGGKV